MSPLLPSAQPGVATANAVAPGTRALFTVRADSSGVHPDCRLCSSAITSQQPQCPHELLEQILRLRVLLANGTRPEQHCTECRDEVAAVSTCGDRHSGHRPLLCSFHIEAHQRDVGTHDHKLLSLDSLWADLQLRMLRIPADASSVEVDEAVGISSLHQQMQLARPRISEAYCPPHNKFAAYVCTPCNVQLCVECAIAVQHNAHHKKPIEQALQAMRPALDASADQLEAAVKVVDMDLRAVISEATHRRLYIDEAWKRADTGGFYLDQRAVARAAVLEPLT